MAINTASNKAIVELPMNNRIVCGNPAGKKLEATTASVINITGISAIKKLGSAGGNFFSTGFSSAKKNPEVSVCMNCNRLPKNGPAIITAGIAIINPYKSTSPMLALNALTKTTGPGCGGKKQCVVDSDAAIGITRYNKGNFVFRASVKTKGTNMMKPAL